MQLNPDGKGYLRTMLTYQGRNANAKVHRLVALAFVPNPQKYPQVHHADGDKRNNCAGNLEWTTNEINMVHAVIHGLRARGEKNYNSKLTPDDVRSIKASYQHGVRGHGLRALAKIYGITPQSVGLVVKGVTWRHVIVPKAT